MSEAYQGASEGSSYPIYNSSEYKKAEERFDDFIEYIKKDNEEATEKDYGKPVSTNTKFIQYLKDEHIYGKVYFEDEIKEIEKTAKEAQQTLANIKAQVCDNNKYFSNTHYSLPELKKKQDDIDSEFSSRLSKLQAKFILTTQISYESPIEDGLKASSECIAGGPRDVYSDINTGITINNPLNNTTFNNIVNNIALDLSGKGIEAFCEHIRLFMIEFASDDISSNNFNNHYINYDYLVNNLDNKGISNVALNKVTYSSPAADYFSEFNNTISKTITTAVEGDKTLKDLADVKGFSDDLMSSFKTAYDNNYEELRGHAVWMDELVKDDLIVLETINPKLVSYRCALDTFSLNGADKGLTLMQTFNKDMNAHISSNIDAYSVTLDQAATLGFNEEQKNSLMQSIMLKYGYKGEEVKALITDGELSSEDLAYLESIYGEATDGNMQMLDAIDITLSVYVSTPPYVGKAQSDCALNIMGLNQGLRDVKNYEPDFVLKDKYTDENNYSNYLIGWKDGKLAITFDYKGTQHDGSQETVTQSTSTLIQANVDTIANYSNGVVQNQMAAIFGKDSGDAEELIKGYTFIITGMIPGGDFITDGVDAAQLVTDTFSLLNKQVSEEEKAQLVDLLENGDKNSFHEFLSVMYNKGYIDSAQQTAFQTAYTSQTTSNTTKFVTGNVVSATVSDNRFYSDWESASSTHQTNTKYVADEKTRMTIEQGKNLAGEATYETSKEIVESNGVDSGDGRGVQYEYSQQEHNDTLTKLNSRASDDLRDEYNNENYIDESGYIDMEDVIKDVVEYRNYYGTIDNSFDWNY